MTWRMVSRRSIRNIQFGLLIVSTGWGLDYLLPPTEDSKVLNFIESHAGAPLWLWGLVMTVFGFAGIIAEIFLSRDENKYWKLWIISWSAHAVFACVFLALAYGAFVSAPLATEGWAGFRTPVTWGFIAILHTAYARRLDKPIDISQVQLPPELDGPANVR